MSDNQHAAVHPGSGGTYLYGRERLGPTWGFLAGWGFILGKCASCAAMAMAIGSYLVPGSAKTIALASVALLTAINYLGIQRTARAVKVLVPPLIAILLLVVITGLGSPAFDPSRLWDPAPSGAPGVLQAGALIFFAFAGYARMQTLGEEVREPARTIPRAMILAVSMMLLPVRAGGSSGTRHPRRLPPGALGFSTCRGRRLSETALGRSGSQGGSGRCILGRPIDPSRRGQPDHLRYGAKL